MSTSIELFLDASHEDVVSLLQELGLRFSRSDEDKSVSNGDLFGVAIDVLGPHGFLDDGVEFSRFQTAVVFTVTAAHPLRSRAEQLAENVARLCLYEAARIWGERKTLLLRELSMLIAQ